jgi:hypothetical protein
MQNALETWVQNHFSGAKFVAQGGQRRVYRVATPEDSALKIWPVTDPIQHERHVREISGLGRMNHEGLPRVVAHLSQIDIHGQLFAMYQEQWLDAPSVQKQRSSRRTRGLLGFGFFYRKDGTISVRVDPKARKALKARLHKMTSRSWGVSMAERIAILNRYIRGWTAYFALAETPSFFAKTDEWLRRRLRQVSWKQWKRVRTKGRMLQRHGIPRDRAWEWAHTRKGSWRVAGSYILNQALTNAYWSGVGLVGFAESYGRIRNAWRTA